MTTPNAPVLACLIRPAAPAPWRLCGQPLAGHKRSKETVVAASNRNGSLFPGAA